MEYRIKETGQVVTDYDFYSMHPNVSGLNQNTCTSFGADPVFPSTPPVAGKYQKIVRDGVELIDGQWREKYSLNDMTQAEKVQADERKAQAVRAERNHKLAQTDWRFRSDMTPSAAWIAYCEALRNLTEQTGFPWEVTFPAIPE